MVRVEAMSSARMLEGRRALVAGAGIAGLAAAIALRRAGAEAVVLERMSWSASAAASCWPRTR